MEPTYIKRRGRVNLDEKDYSHRLGSSPGTGGGKSTLDRGEEDYSPVISSSKETV